MRLIFIQTAAAFLVTAGPCFQPVDEVPSSRRSDAGHEPDAGQAVADSGPPLIDAGLGVVDAGSGLVDAGLDVVDAGPPGFFDGGLPFDAGEPGLTCGPADGGGCHFVAGAQRTCAEREQLSCEWTVWDIVPHNGGLVWITALPDYGLWSRSSTTGEIIRLAPGAVSVGVRGAFAYWVGWWGSTMALQRVALTGGTPEILATGQANQGNVALTDTEVLWTDGRGIAALSLDSGARRWVTQNEGQPEDLVVDDGELYWVNAASGEVRRAPLDGGAPATLFDGLDFPRWTSVVGGYVYWGQSSMQGEVMRGPLDGGPAEVLASNQVTVGGVATDGTWTYWSTGIPNTANPPSIRRVRPGEQPEVLIGASDTTGIAIDATHVYFAGPQLMRVPR